MCRGSVSPCCRREVWVEVVEMFSVGEKVVSFNGLSEGDGQNGWVRGEVLEDQGGRLRLGKVQRYHSGLGWCPVQPYEEEWFEAPLRLFARQR